MAIPLGRTAFLDTNVLLIATDRSRRHHTLGREVFSALPARGIHLALSGQVLREYLVVATRPVEANGLGLELRDALSNVESFLSHAHVCSETAQTTEILCRLLHTSGLSGKRIHDVNLVATMLTAGVDILITENLGDFTPFAEIEAVDLEAALE